MILLLYEYFSINNSNTNENEYTDNRVFESKLYL